MSPYVSQVVVHGDGRKFCSALVSLDPEGLRTWAKANGVAGSYSDLTRDPAVRALVQAAFDAVNKDLASHEQLKRFAILPADLTVESGDLTPSLKLERKVVEKKFAGLLDGLYGADT